MKFSVGVKVSIRQADCFPGALNHGIPLMCAQQVDHYGCGTNQGGCAERETAHRANMVFEL